MKFKKVSMLLLGGLLVTALSGCSLQEIKAWVKQNVVQPARSVLDPVLNPGKQEEPKKEDEKKDDQKPDDQKPDQGGDQGGEGEGGGEQTKNSYTITFQNYDETVLQSGKVEEGELPVYAGEEPTREGDAQYSYSFDGWDKEIVAATADATYTATFTQSVNEYTVKFLNYDDSELQSEKLAYGAMPVYKGAEPTKPETDAATFAFAGWDKEVVAVVGDATYKATFNAVAKEYTVKFMNGEQVLQEGKVAYGETPAYTGEEPTKEQTAQYTFAFNGWEPALGPVTGDVTYQAKFTETVRQYQVTFDSKGGSEVASVMVDYGAHVSAPTAPTKDADAEHIYFFDGWELNGVAFDFENAVIEGPITLEAKWDAVSATEHAHRCTYTHYAQKAADYVNPGYKEFWMCELHHSFVMVQPSEGTINEATAPFAGEILDSDARYIAPLEGGNYFARINVGPENNNGAALPVFRTANAYSHVVGFKLRYRISGAFAEGKSSWMGFYIGAEGKDVYSVYDSTCGGKDVSLFDFDGQWHDVTVRYDGEGLSGYFAFGHALTNFAEGTYVDIDDLVIYGDEIVSEEFGRTPSAKLIESEFVKVGGEAKAALPEERNNFMRIRLTNNIDHTFAYSFKPFTNITSIEYDYRLNKEGGIKEGGSSAWFGVKTGASNQDPDSYQESGYIWNVKTANTSTESSYFNGLWTTHSLSGLSTQGFVGFCTCADFKPGSYLDIDNVKIVADGVTYTETFDSIAPLFGCSSKSSYQQYFSYEYEEVISTDKAFDPEKGELVLYNYANKNTLVTENITDAEKGTCVKIKSLYGYDTIWFGFPQTASNEELLRGLDGKTPTEFYFSVYNSGASDILLQLHYGKDDWNNRPATTFKAGQWTDITLEIDENITDISKISYYKWVGGDADNQVTICDSNAQLTFTAIRVRHVDAAVNPAPFGTVAWDAQTGGVRDIKGRSNTATVSHGVDNDYGAYIQLDDWTCGAGGNLCWLTLSDTAKSVADIKTELGGDIENYFFYIYNPTADAFTFRIMAKSSSGLNPGISVSCAAGAWTKVTIDYNHSDTGYDPITVASQIGLDHQCANNGDSIGSGWKITSVYAEKAATPTVNPAPFGVVALDAQTGYFRDTKGYNAPHTDSHGIDAEYGAYIQIDDWACPSGANQCWITFSDTARDVADIEADLGGAIQNYFFYIYNPLADSFTFKIMLKSSSGMNPNMTVACAAGAWTKVTIAYNQADNGGYPSLTSASQIGLTQVLSNGATVGSGWKITSVYAE